MEEHRLCFTGTCPTLSDKLACMWRSIILPRSHNPYGQGVSSGVSFFPLLLLNHTGWVNSSDILIIFSGCLKYGGAVPRGSTPWASITLSLPSVLPSWVLSLESNISFILLWFLWMRPSERRFELVVGEWAPAAFRLILHGSGQCSVLFDWLHCIPFPAEPCRPSSWRGKHLLYSCKSASLGLMAKWHTMRCVGGISNRACANLYLSSPVLCKNSTLCSVPPCSNDPQRQRTMDYYWSRMLKAF